MNKEQMEQKIQNPPKTEQKTNHDINTDLESAEVLPFGKKDFNAYNRFMANIDKGFAKASDAFVIIGCNLWNIHHNEYYRIDNYKSIADFALDKYELKKSTTHNYIKVVEKFGEISDGKASGIAEKYKMFSCSQLIAMLSFTPEQIEQVTPDMSVRKIIDFGKALPSFSDDDIDDSEIDSEMSDSGNADSESEIMTPPEIVSGRTKLIEFKQFEELLNSKDVILSAYEDMKKDEHFRNKNIRLVLEIAYD